MLNIYIYITLSLPSLRPLIENYYVKHIVYFNYHYVFYTLEFVYFVGIKPIRILIPIQKPESSKKFNNSLPLESPILFQSIKESFLNHPLNQASWRSSKKLYYYHQGCDNPMPPKAMVTPCIILLESSNAHESYHWNIWNLEYHQGCQLPYTRGI